MFRYTSSGPVGPLEPWPFDNPASAYVIRQGSPAASGRLDVGGAGHDHRAGLWRCTSGVFDCTEQGDELMTILSGHCRLTDLATGEALELAQGDSAFVHDGMRARWEIFEDVTKVFFGRKTGGY